MKNQKLKNNEKNINIALNYLSEILVETFLDKMVKEDTNFIDPRIKQPIYDLVNEGKKRKSKKHIKVIK